MLFKAMRRLQAGQGASSNTTGGRDRAWAGAMGGQEVTVSETARFADTGNTEMRRSRMVAEGSLGAQSGHVQCGLCREPGDRGCMW